MKLKSRLKCGREVPDILSVWTESISRQLAVVHLGDASAVAGNIRKDDEVALEIDLPRRSSFSPRYLVCEGHVGFVSRLLDDRIRLGMIVDRMHFRTARRVSRVQLGSVPRSEVVWSGGRS